MATGAVTATATEPLDVVKTRLMAQRRGAAAGAAASAKGAGAGGTPPVDYGYRNVAHGLVTAARSEVGSGGAPRRRRRGLRRRWAEPAVARGWWVGSARAARAPRTDGFQGAPCGARVADRGLPLGFAPRLARRSALARLSLARSRNTSSAGGIDM